jgi:hypothetical protein
MRETSASQPVTAYQPNSQTELCIQSGLKASFLMQFEYLLRTIPAEFPTPELIFDGFVRQDGFMQTLIPTFEDFRDVLAFTFNPAIRFHVNVVNLVKRHIRSGSTALEQF